MTVSPGKRHRIALELWTTEQTYIKALQQCTQIRKRLESHQPKPILSALEIKVHPPTPPFRSSPRIRIEVIDHHFLAKLRTDNLLGDRDHSALRDGARGQAATAARALARGSDPGTCLHRNRTTTTAHSFPSPTDAHARCKFESLTFLISHTHTCAPSNPISRCTTAT